MLAPSLAVSSMLCSPSFCGWSIVFLGPSFGFLDETNGITSRPRTLSLQVTLGAPPKEKLAQPALIGAPDDVQSATNGSTRRAEHTHCTMTTMPHSTNSPSSRRAPMGRKATSTQPHAAICKRVQARRALGLRMIAINLLQNCHFRLQRGRMPPVARSARLNVCLFREPARRATLLHRSELSTHRERVILQGPEGVLSRR